MNPDVNRPIVVVTAAVVEREGRFLLTRRHGGTHLGGRWEFPGGKCEPGEALEASLHREMDEELGVAVDVGREVFRVEHAYPERAVRLHFYSCSLRGEPVPRLGQEMRWVPRKDLRALEFPPADAELIERLSQETGA
jgi:8-oxo-dGTP diphosphatase